MNNLFTSKFWVIIMAGLIYLAWPFLAVQADNSLTGRILLQVESHGEAWYVNPIDSQRYYLGRPDDAYGVMRNLGLGISESSYNQFKNSGADSLKGRILLRVQANGEAYYVNPLDNSLNYLGRPADAFALMRQFGLGISNNNLEIAQSFSLEKNVPDSFYKSMSNSFKELVHYISVNGLVYDFKDRIVKAYQFTQDEEWLFSEEFSRGLDILD
jgi:hypothetical protein